MTQKKNIVTCGYVLSLSEENTVRVVSDLYYTVGIRVSARLIREFKREQYIKTQSFGQVRHCCK
jgi:hypothetical protein